MPQFGTYSPLQQGSIPKSSGRLKFWVRYGGPSTLLGLRELPRETWI
jgi:hypothetical protein